MTTTTSYGTLHQHSGSPWSLRDGIEDALTGHAGDFDVDAIEAEYRGALGELLPDGVTLNGEEFYGPHPMPEDADVEIQAAIEELKGDRFWEIAGKHDKSIRFVHEHNGDKLVVRRYPDGHVYVSVTSPIGSAAVLLAPDAGNGLAGYLQPGAGAAENSAATRGYEDYVRAVNSGVLPAEEEPEGIR